MEQPSHSLSNLFVIGEQNLGFQKYLAKSIFLVEITKTAL